MNKKLPSLALLFLSWALVSIPSCIAPPGFGPPSGPQPAISPLPGPLDTLASQDPSSGSTTWKFAVFGDTHDFTATDTGISPYLSTIAQAIADEKPALVLHVGDLITGFYTAPTSPVNGNNVQQYENWKAAVRPIYDFDRQQGIPLFAIRGNHDDGLLWTDPPLKAAYLETIAPYMPQNGPEGEKGLTYSFTYRQAKFIGLDEYSNKALGLVGGTVNQPWLDEELAQSLPPFTFVFGHPPAVKVSNFISSPYPDPYEIPQAGVEFWNSLSMAGVTAYLCGHYHCYCRVSKDGVLQVVTGNSGADFDAFEPGQVDPEANLLYPPAYRSAADGRYGYVVYTVDEAARTLSGVQKRYDLASGTWSIGDTFTFQR